MNIIERTGQDSKTELIIRWVIPVDPTILIIRTFDKKGEWMIEVVFEGGAKAVTAATADEVTTIESDLSDRGWQIEPSLWSNGFSAKPAPIEEFIFASSADLWPDDLGLSEPTL